MKLRATALAAVLGCAWLASCAYDRHEEPAPLMRPRGIAQADDGRFLTCVDCERPTPKTVGRQIASAQRLPAAVSTALATLSASAAAASAASPAHAPTRGALRMARASLLFDADSAELTSQARQRLQHLMPVISEATSVRSVGFTDDTGGQPRNDRLATSRALAVMVEMRRQLGASSGGPALSADGRGLCCYLNGNRDADERARNRRVELQLRFQDTPAVDRLVSRHADLLELEAGQTVSQRSGSGEAAGGAHE
ncbi:OmpA family protein [Ideonella sp. YS5]|uniref:OmpA family protein n=1 Tax=Ideonella sp. YS5 TaxID=3453714 RepID=UPI003EEED654